MTNVLKNRLRSIEWTVKMTYYSTTYVSEAFSLQSRKCHLEFVCYTHSNYISYLYLKSNKELKSPVKVTVCISNADGTLNEQSSQTITSANTTIWSHSSLLSNYLMTFKIIIHDGASKRELLFPFKEKKRKKKHNFYYMPAVVMRVNFHFSLNGPGYKINK